MTDVLPALVLLLAYGLRPIVRETWRCGRWRLRPAALRRGRAGDRRLLRGRRLEPRTGAARSRPATRVGLVRTCRSCAARRVACTAASLDVCCSTSFTRIAAGTSDRAVCGTTWRRAARSPASRPRWPRVARSLRVSWRLTNHGTRRLARLFSGRGEISVRYLIVLVVRWFAGERQVAGAATSSASAGEPGTRRDTGHAASAHGARRCRAYYDVELRVTQALDGRHGVLVSRDALRCPGGRADERRAFTRTTRDGR